jgi:nickel/cobalt exporter
VTLTPGRIEIDYEVSLSELTLTQELRGLIGELPGAGRSDWFDAYGRETGPLNAKGFQTTVNGEQVSWSPVRFELRVEEHPIYHFRFEAKIPRSGRLRLRDGNFESSQGTSRLALSGRGVAIRGSDVPTDVQSISPKPVWKLTDEEERQTRSFQVDYESLPDGEPAGSSQPTTQASVKPSSTSETVDVTRRRWGLGTLFDRASRWSLVLVGLLAFGLGAVHAMQPGHGKTIVVATVVERGGFSRVATLAAITTVVHTSSVFLVALLLWWTTSERFGDIHIILTRAAGYVIASVGFWRIGRALAGIPEHPAGSTGARPSRERGLLALGVAGGLVPCWDAVGLVVMAEAVGRLGLALGLVAAFSLGLGVALTAIGLVAVRFRQTLVRNDENGVWTRRLGLVGGSALALMGVSLLAFSRWV